MVARPVAAYLVKYGFCRVAQNGVDQNALRHSILRIIFYRLCIF